MLRYSEFAPQRVLFALAMLGASTPALAHEGHDRGSDILSVTSHALGGVDPVLAMLLAAGIVAGIAGRRWLVQLVRRTAA